MLSVEDALTAVLEAMRPFPVASFPLNGTQGTVLAEDIVSDVDSPPFDKALMDGFAVRTEDIKGSGTELRIIGEVTAGRVAERPLAAGEAFRIMTGAPLPEDCDAVVKLEETEAAEDGTTVQITADGIDPGANLMRQGAAMRRGDTVVSAGRRLRPQELGALAELGRATVPVRRRPHVAVLATGDELVPVEQTPGPGQIRNSNETMLAAQIRRAGGQPVLLGIARDEREHLRQKIEKGLKSDILLLSGGVSAGKLDLVPSELEAAGVQQVFHKVRVKPGKPLWFGTLDASGEWPGSAAGSPRNERAGGSLRSTPATRGGADTQRRYVFGLPGNPVSSLVCFELFVRPAIRRLMGAEPAAPQPVKARLARDHLARGNRPTYHPSRLRWESDGPVVEPLDWQGSADLRATADADAMTLFPPGEATYRAGETVDVYPWD